MKEQIKQQFELLNDMIKYYSFAPKARRAVEDGDCEYLSANGNKCAIGRALSEDQLKMAHQNEGHSATFVINQICDGTLLNQGSIFWESMQSFHDGSSNWKGRGLSDHGKLRLKQFKNRIESGKYIDN